MTIVPFETDTTRYSGRPSNTRTDVEEASYDLLEHCKVAFLRTDHAPAMTIELCHEVEKVLGAKICKNLFLCNRQKTDFYLLLIDGDKVFKTKHLSAQLGCSRLSFADEVRMSELLKVQPGSASVLALLNDKDQRIRLVIDRPVLQDAVFACHPCKNTSTVSFLTKELTEKLLPAMNHDYIIVDLPEGEDA